jgi:cytochrome b6-f complex iron-sulfur subunit
MIGAGFASFLGTTLNARSQSSRNDGFIPIATVTDFRDGQIYQPQSPAGPILIVQISSNPTRLSAVNPTCTHNGCKVNWQQNNHYFACPCHASIFDTDGSVINGPAVTPLQSFRTMVDNNTVLIRPSLLDY